MNSQPKERKSNKNLLLRYAGLTMQIMVSLALALYAGYKADEWLRWETPVLVWVLPLVVIVVMIWQVIKDTSKK